MLKLSRYIRRLWLHLRWFPNKYPLISAETALAQERGACEDRGIALDAEVTATDIGGDYFVRNPHFEYGSLVIVDGQTGKVRSIS